MFIHYLVLQADFFLPRTDAFEGVFQGPAVTFSLKFLAFFFIFFYIFYFVYMYVCIQLLCMGVRMSHNHITGLDGRGYIRKSKPSR